MSSIILHCLRSSETATGRLLKRFDELVEEGRLVSTREVYREIEDSSIETLRAWASQKKALFPAPTAAQGEYVTKIYRVSHFQQNIEQRKLLRGGKIADPFVIARAACENRTVVTGELLKPNAVKIPNICKHFGIKCLSLFEFMEEEGWSF